MKFKMKQKQFYENLYANKDSQLIDIDLHVLFKNNDIKKLNKDESESIEGPITNYEAALILRPCPTTETQDQMVLALNFLKMF